MRECKFKRRLREIYEVHPTYQTPLCGSPLFQERDIDLVIDEILKELRSGNLKDVLFVYDLLTDWFVEKDSNNVII